MLGLHSTLCITQQSFSDDGYVAPSDHAPTHHMGAVDEGTKDEANPRAWGMRLGRSI